MTDAEQPAREVDFVRAVVADLSRSPPLEPVPVVVNHIIAIPRARSGSLPELPVQTRRNRRDLPFADRRPRIGVPRACQVRSANESFANGLSELDHMGCRARLRSELDEASVLAGGRNQQFGLPRVVTAGLFEVDVFSGAQREDGCRGV